MQSFRTERSAAIPAAKLKALRAGFAAGRASDDETLATIRRIHEETGEVIDPHTAVAVHTARLAARSPGVPMVTLACAHPAKFPDAVERATGVRPLLPPRLADLFEREERFTVLPNDLRTVQDFVGSRARAA